MNRAALLALISLFTLPVAYAQESRPAASAAPLPQATPGNIQNPTGAAPAPVTIPVKVEPAAYYPPPGSLQPPLTAEEVCRSLRGGLNGAEVAQDVRERGFTGPFGDDEAADARAAGAAPDFLAALRAGRFTVSPAYARRYAEATAKGRRNVEANAWRAEAADRAQAGYREGELHRQGQIASENNRAIAVKEREDKQRFQEMKDKADWESRQRQAYNANDGWWHEGRWYGHRYKSGKGWRYY